MALQLQIMYVALIEDPRSVAAPILDCSHLSVSQIPEYLTHCQAPALLCTPTSVA